MKKLIALLLCVNIYIAGNAQEIKISGKVVDEKSEAVIAASIALISMDSTLISSTITNAAGDFELKTLKRPESCYLRVKHIEFEECYHAVVPDQDTTLLVFTNNTLWLMNTGIYYNSPKNNWSLSLDANDILRSENFREMYFDNNYSRQYSYGSSRYVQLSFILKFKGGERVENKAKSGDVESSRFSKKQ